jgi:hypothetical protein
MGSHDSFGHLKHKLWPKERLGIKLTLWLSTTKSQESTGLPYVKVACDMSLESSQWGLQLCFRPHLNLRFAYKIIGPQSGRSPSCGNFKTLETKCHLNVGLVERHRVHYKREGGGFLQVQAVVSLVSLNCPWLVLAPKVLQPCTNHLVLVLRRSVWIVDTYHSS